MEHFNLKDTAQMMLNEDYRVRFIAEYVQTKIRYEKLHKMLIKYEAEALDFKPTCPFGLLSEQASAMGSYLRCLEIRAEMEHIQLPEVALVKYMDSPTCK